MFQGTSRYRLRGNRFQVRPNVAGAGATSRRITAVVQGRSQHQEETAAIGLSSGQASDSISSSLRMFAKPTGAGMAAGLIGSDTLEIVHIARDMYDNDAVSAGVVDVISDIPFGDHSLGSMPDKDLLEPYLRSMDRVRVKTLLPVLARSFLVDGAFLGTGVFSAREKVFDAIIPQDILHATITPLPTFGSTPIVDLHITPDQQRMMAKRTDPRFQRLAAELPESFRKSGLIKLQPENTFYIPRRTLAHIPLGTSLFRKIMVAYILEKALARGTLEMAYRRQRPINHIMAGDENWDPSQDELQALSDVFMAADLDPLGAVVVTRQGVQSQDVGGAGELWRWTDNIDVLTNLKLKGLGLPDGLLGGDMALDSVSATLTVFINMMRSFRDYITRMFFYEKMFPYISITNDHKKTSLGAFQETGYRYGSVAADIEGADISDYLMPTLSWHNSMRPEGDKEYMEMLNELAQSGVPVPLRLLAAGGGLNIHDLLNAAPDDMEIREKVAQYQAQIQELQAANQGGDDQGYGEQGRFIDDLIRRSTPIRRRGLLSREYDDRMLARHPHNGPRPQFTTARESQRMEHTRNKTIATAASNVHTRLRKMLAVQHVRPGVTPPPLPGIFGVRG